MALIQTAPAPNDYRRRLAQKLMADAADPTQPVEHWMQGLAKLGQGALGGYQMYQADQKDKEAEQGQYSALGAALARYSVPSEQPAASQPLAKPQPIAPVVSAQPSAVPAAVSGPRPGGPVEPSARVWGDKEAEDVGLYPKPAKVASLSAPAPSVAPAASPSVTPVSNPAPTGAEMDAAKARIAKIAAVLNDPNASIYEKRQAAQLGQALLLQEMKPAQYDFKVVGENLIRTDSKGNSSVVPGMSATKPTWGVIGKDDFGREQYGWIDPGNRTTTPAGPQSGAPIITGPDGKPIAIPPGTDPRIIREAASKRAAEESMPASSDSTSKLRNEVQGLPSYKNIAQAAPVYKSMLEAAGRDTRAADVNMIYGMAKIMDPGSVVRESEMTVAQAIATLPQQLQATITSQLAASGRLTPEIRAAIMQEAHSRIAAYQTMFDQDAAMYRGIAQRNRMNEADVLPTFGPYETYKPAAPAAPTGKAAAPTAAPKGVDPKIWQHMTPEERALWK